jgi:hypothetical protein
VTETPALEYRILPNNGSGWYWELVSPDREVIARGLADTHAQARVDAMIAGIVRQRTEPVELKVS